LEAIFGVGEEKSEEAEASDHAIFSEEFEVVGVSVNGVELEFGLVVEAPEIEVGA